MRVMAPVGVIALIEVMALGCGKKLELNYLIRFRTPIGCDNPDTNSASGVWLRATTCGCGPHFQM